LRSQFQGRQGRRRDVPASEPDHPMIPLAAFALAGCLAVGAGNDRILAGDLAAGFPEWAAVPPETPLALAPAPGVQRVFRVLELRRLAERWSLSAVPDREVCVTRPVAVFSAGKLLAAMQEELPAAHIELRDFSRQPAPEGALVFPVSGLRQGPEGGYWNGYVRYGGNHRFTLWARVKVTVARARVVAAQDLKPGVVLDAAQLRVETREEVPAAGLASAVEEAAGTVPSGAIGETSPILNPVSKRRFQARVESKGRVVVTKGSL